MNKGEFAGCMAYLAATLNQSISEERSKQFYNLLGDLPLDVLRIACKRVVLEHPWPTFPSVAEIRQAASETILGQVAELPPAEAWRLASQAMAKIDCEIAGPYMARNREGVMTQFPSQTAAVMANLPPLVRKTVSAYGVRAWTQGREPIGVIRGQFLRMFEQNVAQFKRLALMPPALQKEIEAKSPASLPSVAHNALSQIGVEK